MIARLSLLGTALLLAGCGTGGDALEVTAATRYNGPPASTGAANEVKVVSTVPESQPASMTKPAATIERRTIYFSGTVQGVGFRATTAQLSHGQKVAGEVRNLDDGRVELVIEGAPGDIDAFVKKVREHFGSYIRSIEQSSSTARGMPPGVRITY
jgi:acylphosphatase